MTREITTHKVNGCNEALTVTAVDEPGHGGANNEYRIIGFRRLLPDEPDPQVGFDVPFQNGPIATAGTNGITHESLLAILIDRLRSFQNGKPGELELTARGPYACRENAIALTKLEEAMMWLQKRTLARVIRGVEGTHAK